MNTVLLVDDEPHILRIMSMTLRREGYEIITATDGQSGLEQFVTHSPDAVIVDIDMPQMDGLEMCHQIYTKFPQSSAAIYIATSRAESEYRERVASVPGLTFIEKPISMRSLIPELCTRLRKKEGPTSAGGREF
jgi:DNA-binding response OmpR family regulator